MNRLLNGVMLLTVYSDSLNFHNLHSACAILLPLGYAHICYVLFSFVCFVLFCFVLFVCLLLLFRCCCLFVCFLLLFLVFFNYLLLNTRTVE